MSDLESLYRCVGDYPIVYECAMASDVHVYVPDGPMDSRYSYTKRTKRRWHVVATSQALAEAAWHTEFGHASTNNLLSCVPICVIDRELTIR